MPTLLKKNPAPSDHDFQNNLLNDLDHKNDEQHTYQESNYFTPGDNSNKTVTSATGKPKSKVSIRKILSLIIITISVLLLSVGAYAAYTISSASGKSLGQGENLNFFDRTSQILGTILNPTKRVALKGESEGKTNFLLLGADNAAGLTDSIMILSYYHKEKKMVTVNIPRDTSAFDGYSTQKINSVYSAGVNRNRNSENKEALGAENFAKIISKEFDIPIHYWAVVNFKGVVRVVDELGGIEVNVENNFTDCEYPTENNDGRFIRPCPTFKAGKQKMNGRTALIYSRSRHSLDNNEGSDFARGRRQSIVFQGILQTIKDKSIFENVTKISSYIDILGSNLKTNIKIDEIYSLSQILKEIDISSSFSRLTWATGNGFLCVGPNPEISYVITYCGGAIIGKPQASSSRQKAKDVMQNLLKATQENDLFEAPVFLISNQSAQIVKTQREFQQAGFNDVKVNNVFKDLTPIKKGEIETKTLYILDPKIKELYDTVLNEKPDLGTTQILTELPKDIILPKTNETAKIVVVIK